MSRLPQPGDPCKRRPCGPLSDSLSSAPGTDRQVSICLQHRRDSSDQEGGSNEKHSDQLFHTLDQDQIENPQPLAAFLLPVARGHCEYFASSMVALRAVKVQLALSMGFSQRIQ
jgi:hypothetical protein